MYKYERLLFMVALMVIQIALVACQQVESKDNAALITTEVEGIEDPGANLANPAAVYCEGLGYSFEPRENAAGMDTACIFPDGSECGQWDFLSGRCGQECTYCHQHGGDIQDNGTNIGICAFKDGSTCNEFMLYKGECIPDKKSDVSNESNEKSEKTEPSVDATSINVVGWMGYVVSTPEGAQ